MHQILDETRGDLIAVRITEKLDSADFASLIPMLEARIKEHGKIRLYWETEDFEGWTAEGFAADLGFDIDHAEDFSRIAMVGETKWEKALSKLMSPFTRAEVRFFDIADRDSALSWIQADP